MNTAASPQVNRYTRSRESTATAATSSCRLPAGSCSQPATGSRCGALAANGRHAVDLDEPLLVDEPRHLDGRARRSVRAEEPVALGDDDRAVAHVPEVPVELDDVADRRAAGGEDAMDVLEYLLRLLGGVTFAHQLAGLVDGDLPGHVD